MAITSKQKDATKVEQLIEKQEKLLPVRHVTRIISRMGVEDTVTGVFTTAEKVEKRLAEYYMQGYKLFATHLIQSMPEGYEMMYILVLDK